MNMVCWTTIWFIPTTNSIFEKIDNDIKGNQIAAEKKYPFKYAFLFLVKSKLNNSIKNTYIKDIPNKCNNLWCNILNPIVILLDESGNVYNGRLRFVNVI